MKETKYYRTVKTKDRLPGTEIQYVVCLYGLNVLQIYPFYNDHKQWWKDNVEYWLEEFEMPKMTK